MNKSQLLLALGMLVAGSLNTITTNFADNAKADGTEAPSTIWGKLNGETERKHLFDHPFFQAVCMFLGESLCMGAYLATRKKTSARETTEPRSGGEFYWAIPAMCDMIGTGTMYAGLCLSYPSIFQMLRGSSIIFTALISIVFLRNRLYVFHWFAIFLVLVGIVIVGYVSLEQDTSGSKPQGAVIVGDILIMVAQVIVACQMCIEEKIMGLYGTPPLKVVGLEGMFGFTILSILLVPMYFIRIDGHPFENTPDAFVQISENPVIPIAMLGNILSIAFFNFFGISITQAMSASHRMVLDSVRTLVVWGASLALGWEHFHWLQLVGFVVLTLGTAMYNEIIKAPWLFNYPVRDAAGEAPQNELLTNEGRQASFDGYEVS
jgi:drug/metabolite transporter (DMT)-like permease